MSERQRQALVWGFAIYAVSTLVSMAVMSIGAAIAFAALLFALGGARGLSAVLSAELERPVVRQYAWAMGALFLACGLSLVVAAIDPLVYGGMRPTIHIARDLAKAWYLFWPLILLPGLERLGARGRGHVLRAWLVAFGVLSAIGAVQHFTGWPRPQPIPDVPGRFHATLFLGHHLSVASVFIFPFFVALGFLRSRDGARSLGLSRGVLIVIALLGAVTLFDTYSRTLWIALPIGILAWVLWSLPRRAAMATVLAMVIAGSIGLALPQVRDRLGAARGIVTREKLWAANWEFFKRRPFTGTGWHHNIEISGFYLMDLEKTDHVFSGHAHNNVLDVLGGLGLIGLIAWLAWCVVTMGLLARLARRPGRGASADVAVALLCAWVVFQLNGLTQVNFWEAKVLHQMMWMVAWSLAWVELGQKKEEGVFP